MHQILEMTLPVAWSEACRAVRALEAKTTSLLTNTLAIINLRKAHMG